MRERVVESEPERARRTLSGGILVFRWLAFAWMLNSPTYGLLGVGLGAGPMGWGGYTRVRRRAASGSLLSLLAVLLMLAAPIAGSIDEIGPAFMRCGTGRSQPCGWWRRRSRLGADPPTSAPLPSPTWLPSA